MKKIGDEYGCPNLPKNGDEVGIHYTCKLASDNSVIVSTKGKQRKKIRVGDPGVVEGMSEALKTMRTDEVSQFAVRADKAYGARGAPPKIPPNATLVFDIELKTIARGSDCSAQGDGSVMKLIDEPVNDVEMPSKRSDIAFELQSLRVVKIGPKDYERTVLRKLRRKNNVHWLAKNRDGMDGLPAGLRWGLEAMLKREVSRFVIKGEAALKGISLYDDDDGELVEEAEKTEAPVVEGPTPEMLVKQAAENAAKARAAAAAAEGGDPEAEKAAAFWEARGTEFKAKLTAAPVADAAPESFKILDLGPANVEAIEEQNAARIANVEETEDEADDVPALEEGEVIVDVGDGGADISGPERPYEYGKQPRVWKTTADYITKDMRPSLPEEEAAPAVEASDSSSDDDLEAVDEPPADELFELNPEENAMAPPEDFSPPEEVVWDADLEPGCTIHVECKCRLIAYFLPRLLSTRGERSAATARRARSRAGRSERGDARVESSGGRASRVKIHLNRIGTTSTATASTSWAGRGAW